MSNRTIFLSLLSVVGLFSAIAFVMRVQSSDSAESIVYIQRNVEVWRMPSAVRGVP